MRGMTVAVVGDPQLAAQLGKKGTVSDVSFFNLKRGEVGVTYVVPSMYPEKLQSLTMALGMADAAILVVANKDRALGEAIVALDSFGVRGGAVVLRNYIQREEVAPFFSGTALDGYRFSDGDPNGLNDSFAAQELPAMEGPARVPVDHFFDVRGVGTVALGCVKRGSVRPHDELRAYPTEKVGLVRSIQVHDNDVPEAGLGNRVGLAMKGLEVGDLDRGHVLAPPGSMKVAERVEVQLSASRFWKGAITEGSVAHAVVGLQARPVKVEGVACGTVKGGIASKVLMRFDRPVAYDAGDRLVLLDLDNKGLRIVGWGSLA
jgi:selenocysteine-specific translation elongation factor